MSFNNLNSYQIAQYLKASVVETGDTAHPYIDPQSNVLPTLINKASFSYSRALQGGSIWSGIGFHGELISGEKKDKTYVHLTYDGLSPLPSQVKDGIGNTKIVEPRIALQTQRQQNLDTEVSLFMRLRPIYTAPENLTGTNTPNTNRKQLCKLSSKVVASHLLQYGLNPDPQGYTPFDRSLITVENLPYIQKELEYRFSQLDKIMDRDRHLNSSFNEPLSGAKVVQDILTTQKRNEWGSSSKLTDIAVNKNLDGKSGVATEHGVFLLNQLNPTLCYKLEREYINYFFFNEIREAYKRENKPLPSANALGFPNFDNPDRLKVASMLQRDLPSAVRPIRQGLIAYHMKQNFDDKKPTTNPQDISRLQKIKDTVIKGHYKQFFTNKNPHFSSYNSQQQQEYINSLDTAEKPYCSVNIHNALKVVSTKQQKTSQNPYDHLLEIEVTPKGTWPSTFKNPIIQNEYITNSTLVLNQTTTPTPNAIQNAGVTISHNSLDSIQHYTMGVVLPNTDPNDKTANPKTTNKDFAKQFSSLVYLYHEEQKKRQAHHEQIHKKDIEKGQRVTHIPSNRHITLQFSTISHLFKKDNYGTEDYLSFVTHKDAPLPSITIDDFSGEHLKRLATLTDPVYLETCKRYDDLLNLKSNEGMKKARLEFLKNYVLKDELAHVYNPFNPYTVTLPAPEGDEVTPKIREAFNYRIQEYRKEHNNYPSLTQLDNILSEVDFGGTAWEIRPESLFNDPKQLDLRQKKELQYFKQLPPSLTQVASQEALLGLQIHRYEAIASILNLPEIHQELVKANILTPNDIAKANAYHGVRADNLMWQLTGSPFGDYTEEMAKENFVKHPLSNLSFTQFSDLKGQELNARKIVDSYLKGFAVSNQSFRVTTDEQKAYFDNGYPLTQAEKDRQKAFFANVGSYSDDFVRTHIENQEKNLASQVALGVTLVTGERVLQNLNFDGKTTINEYPNAPYHSICQLNTNSNNPVIATLSRLVSGLGSFDTSELSNRFDQNSRLSGQEKLTQDMLRRQLASIHNESYKNSFQATSRLDLQGIGALFSPNPKVRFALVTAQQSKILACPTILAIQMANTAHSYNQKTWDLRFTGSRMDVKKPINSFATIPRDYAKELYHSPTTNIEAILETSKILRHNHNTPSNQINPAIAPTFYIPKKDKEVIHPSLENAVLYGLQEQTIQIMKAKEGLAMQQDLNQKLSHKPRTTDILDIYLKDDKDTKPVSPKPPMP